MAESLSPSERMDALARNDNPDASKTNSRRAARLRAMEVQMEEIHRVLTEIEMVKGTIRAWDDRPYTRPVLLAAMHRWEKQLRIDLKNLETTYSRLK